MRIISGIYKGRKISGHDIEGTRPTMDRVRESLFAMIQEFIENATVLDLFAGTGSLGFESISNGAAYCYFNDKNRECIRVINETMNYLDSKEKCRILNYDYKEALHYFQKNNIQFDIIFLDPPYKMKINHEIIDYILKNNLLNKEGIIVCEMDSDYMATLNIKEYKRRRYGDKEIVIFILE